ncbi:NAD(P)-binding protein [Rhodobacter calidifons]|uniref:NAD(P)-binding protein n=1 Tax=Rhodobacter calidifons TaxID=2715277 RepID=UPI00349E75F2
MVGLITITLSVYMITWSHRLYERLGPYLGIFERRNPMREKEDDTPGSDTRPHDVLVLGLGRYGFRIAQALAEDGFRPLGVDFNPETVRMARDRGFDAVLGDASDPEMLAHLPLAGIRAAISATPAVAAPLTDADPHATVIRALRDLGHSGLIAVTAEEEPLAERYRNLGAAIVLSPYADAAEEAARRLRDALRGDKGAPEQTAE